MRIRKRQVPFPLSDPRPIPPSPVPQLPRPSSPSSSIPLLLQQPHATALSASLLDHDLEDARDSSRFVAEAGPNHHRTEMDRQDEAGGGPNDGGEKRDDTGKGVLFGSGAVFEVVPLPPSNLDGKWCDGEKAIPPKKRRGRAGDCMNTRECNNNNNKKMKTRMKTKMNKKCTQNDDERHGGEEEERKEEEVNVNANTSKKRGRASVTMEGSRCSRVNGRGWRCCQQTLVGYSLCEHHLGKGRLRSITSVRSRSVPSATTATENNDSLSLDDSLCGASSSSSPEKKINVILRAFLTLTITRTRRNQQ
ncbi:uncharacterized protein LOC129306899 [Prosopis cineraria]|uniref:uncharacterized protein LOC129306899 n=1 Tax=Prosopis cineraria TaxID=364024 RepID=UPI002410888F|nr:uncharacterized protein LOC129306899 [Prosopis cineraria]